MEVGFSLGSNLGDRLANLSEAKRRVLEQSETQLLAYSSAYQTSPVGVLPQHAHLHFLNAVLIVETSVSAEEWLERIWTIERALGRVRGRDRNAPRTIDIDILYAGDACIDSQGLVVPHPRWTKRRFVVQPLADVRPDLRLPGVGRTVRDVLAAFSDNERIELYASKW